MPRPKIVWTDVEFQRVKNLCAIQCTGEEIAAVMGVDYDTMNRLLKEKYNITFSEFFKIYSKDGLASLRRNQWKAADKGNVTMLIWLGKQYLNQTDKVENTNMEKITIVNDINKE